MAYIIARWGTTDRPECIHTNLQSHTWFPFQDGKDTRMVSKRMIQCLHKCSRRKVYLWC